MRPWLTLVCAAALTGAPALAQTSTSSTASDGESFAKSIRDGNSNSVLAEGAEQNVPGYSGTDIAATRYADDEDGLTDAGIAQRYGDTNYDVVIDDSRPEYDTSTIDLSSAKEIEANPETYVGTTADGSTGTCEPVPTSGTGNSTYYETCNEGDQIITSIQTCSATLDTTVTKITVYRYLASDRTSSFVDLDTFSDEIAAGTCTVTVKSNYCSNITLYGGTPTSDCKDYETSAKPYIVECTAEANVQGYTIFGGFFTFPAIATTTGEHWYAKGESTSVSVVRNDSACSAFAGNSECVEQGAEVCTDSDPLTRTIDGVAVTQPCWAWTRTFECNERRAGNDCSELEAKAECKFDHQECLSENEDGSCNVYDNVYACTTSGTTGETTTAYICSGDLYCINGECTQVDREASTEFKDAMVAVQTMGTVKDEFDADNLTLFNGEKAGCHKPVFGLVNCCAGKTSGVLIAAAGAAAIASGPAAIAALATPLLTTFLCSTDEMTLDVKDRMGLCHYVGTYCSDKVLGVCTSKRKNYCCFESKLSRILQEQGREQLGMGWGKARSPDCEGFTIDEFQQLDLSQMDFTEVYDEFVDAAKVPDEVETSIQIQEKIEEYYKQATGT